MDLAEPLLHAEIMMSNSMTLSLILRSQLSNLSATHFDRELNILAAPTLHNEDVLVPHRGFWY